MKTKLDLLDREAEILLILIKDKQNKVLSEDEVRALEEEREQIRQIRRSCSI